MAPTKSDIRAATPDMLNKDLYVVTTTPVDGMDAVMTNLEEHLAFQVDLERRGIMFGAGPPWEDDEHSWNGEGLVIIRADSLAHAREIAESDPMHRAGARRFTVRPWMMNEGTVTVRITYSNSRHEVT